MLDENKWLAARHGLEGELVDLPERRLVPTKELVRRRYDALREHAQDLGSADELEGILDLLEAGNGARRQQLVYEANHDYVELMREIVAASAP
jgi:carboxylate-amine ligase